MSNSQLFMSYSRQELYFAEAVVLGLQKTGVEVWFDLQQLEPGCNWEEAIAEGLRGCSGIILLVSRASIHSKWVAQEWMNAIDAGKPIYLLLFEAVDFASFSVQNDDGSVTEIPLNLLPERAAAVIDMRRDFRRNLRRVYHAVTGQAAPEEAAQRDPMPAPNRYGLPVRLPLGIGFVLWALILLTVFTAAVTLLIFSAYPPMILAGVIITGWLVGVVWAFMQRSSYRQARIALTCAPFVMVFFAPWSVPIFAAAALVSLTSRDIHRWSPLGQGLRRPRPQRRRTVPSPSRLLDAAAILYGRVPGLIKAVLEIDLGLLSLMSIVSWMGTLTLIWLLAVPALLFLLIYLRAHLWRLRRRGLGKVKPTGLTYTVFAAAEDMDISDQIRAAMNKVGHRESVMKPGSDLDYSIVVLTNYSEDYILNRLKDGSKGLIFVVASALDNWDRFQPFAHFQWVDYRLQWRERLDAMAQDLLVRDGDNMTHSFSTRLVPQNFNILLLPGRIAFYTGLQLFSFNLFIAGLIRSMGQTLTVTDVVGLGFGVFSSLTGLWIVNRVMRREITVVNIVLINFALTNAAVLLGIVLALIQFPVSNPNLIWLALALLLIGITIGEGIGLLLGWVILDILLDGWLPSYLPSTIKLPRLRRDLHLWRRNAVTGVLVALFTLLLIGAPLESLPGENGRDIPIAAVLRRVDNQFNRDVADALNALFAAR